MRGRSEFNLSPGRHPGQVLKSCRSEVTETLTSEEQLRSTEPVMKHMVVVFFKIYLLHLFLLRITPSKGDPTGVDPTPYLPMKCQLPSAKWNVETQSPFNVSRKQKKNSSMWYKSAHTKTEEHKRCPGLMYCIHL